MNRDAYKRGFRKAVYMAKSAMEQVEPGPFPTEVLTTLSPFGQKAGYPDSGEYDTLLKDDRFSGEEDSEEEDTDHDYADDGQDSDYAE